MHDDPKFCPWCGKSSLTKDWKVMYDKDTCDKIRVYHGGDKITNTLIDVKCNSCGEYFAVYGEVSLW